GRAATRRKAGVIRILEDQRAQRFRIQEVLHQTIADGTPMPTANVARSKIASGVMARRGTPSTPLYLGSFFLGAVFPSTKIARCINPVSFDSSTASFGSFQPALATYHVPSFARSRYVRLSTHISDTPF